ncbi:MAG: sulfatase-like hydrolase/transferase [Planctomycetota bacterium]|jgi:hypothetical protein
MSEVDMMQEKWDYLIILDACRYDYFEQVWQDYLPGDLEKRISVGSATREWRNKSFTGYYDDVVYVSANPHINSSVRIKGFLATEHFFKVHDLWQDEWDNEKGTVLPEVVTNRAIDIIGANPGKRAIVHYIQPHQPYLSFDMTEVVARRYRSVVRKMPDKTKSRGASLASVEKVLSIINTALYCIGLRGHLAAWKLREFLSMPPANHTDAIRREHGKEALRRAYKENLEIVLESAARLVDALSGKIVVTSDHGEVLGENNCYEHWSRSSNKFLLEIPWLVIDKGIRTTEPARSARDEGQQKTSAPVSSDKRDDDETKRKIQEKLKALGYY